MSKFVIYDKTVNGPAKMHGPLTERQARTATSMFVRNLQTRINNHGLRDEMEVNVCPQTGHVSVFHKNHLHRKLVIYQLNPGWVTLE